MNKRLIKHTNFMNLLKSWGAKTFVHKMPCCGKDLETALAESQQQYWEFDYICPHCDSLVRLYIYHTQIECTVYFKGRNSNEV